MPRQQASRQHHNQPPNSFSTSSDSSTSYLSTKPKSHSPRSNFNPFSPLSPHPPDKELEDSDDDDSGAIFNMEDSIGSAGRARRVYTRAALVMVGKECRQRGFVKPKGMGSLESWFGTLSIQALDPAIVSIGSAPNRRNGGGGFGEGFGYGGGIGGKGLNRGGRNNGPRRNDHDGHGPTHGPLHGPLHNSAGPTKDNSAGIMGKFGIKSTPDRMRLGGDENRKPKDDWRRDQPPHQNQRNENRHYNSRQEEDNAIPAWMNDEPEDTTSQKQLPEEDRFGAHKRAARAGAEGSERRRLVGFFDTEQAPEPVRTPAKPVKEYNAANYLLPQKAKQQIESEPAPPQEAVSQSRFSRFFDAKTSAHPSPSRLAPTQIDETAPTPSRVSPLAHTSLSTASPVQSPPPADVRQHHHTNLMAMLSGHKPTQPPPPAAAPSPPPLPTFHQQTGVQPMQPPPVYGQIPPNTYRPMPQHHPGHAPPPPLQQQHLYGGPVPPQFFHPQQQGFLPPGMSLYPPQPPPGFASDQHPYYQGHLPMQPLLPQQPRNAAPQERNMHPLLNQWQSQPPR